MNKQVRIGELYRSVPDYIRPLLDRCELPWEVLPLIGDFIRDLLARGLDGFRELAPGILVGEGVEIASTATVIAPAVLGAGTEVRTGAYLRGAVVCGESCVIGNSSEIKNAVLMAGVQIPHYNYVGDSILGHRVHLGAGAICSNLRTDGRSVTVHADVDYETGLRKVGAFLGDGAEVGCSAVLNPGCVVGRGSSVYPLTAVRGVVPPFAIVKDAHTTVKKRKKC